MKNKKRLGLLMGCIWIAMSLSGCATAILNAYVGEQDHYRTTQEFVFQDQLIAIGHASQTVAEYQNALVLAGEKYSYFITPVKDKDATMTTEMLNTILQNIDLKYLQIHQPGYVQQSMRAVISRQQLENPIVFEMKKDGKSMNTEIYLVYRKSLAQIEKNEQNELEKLKFECLHSQKELQCVQKISIDLRLAQHVNNKQQLQHRFKQPLELIVFQTKQKSKFLQTAKNVALYPLAITFDLVTSPIQVVGFLSHKTPKI